MKTPTASLGPNRAPSHGAQEERNDRENRQHSDPSSYAAEVDWLAQASQVSIIGLFAIAILYTAYLTHAVLVPVLLAWVIATIVLPVINWMQHHRIPRVVAVIVVTLALVSLMIALLTALSNPVTYWLGRASELGALVKEKLQTINQPLAFLTELRKALSLASASDKPAVTVEQPTATIIATAFAVLTPAVSQLILFIGALVFYLVYQKEIRHALVFFFGSRPARLIALRTLNDIDEKMSIYFGTFTIVNGVLGIVTVALTAAIGLPNPLLWGVLAAVMNYIPYVGVAFVLVTLFTVGLLTFPSLSDALVAPLIYLAITALEGHFLTPAFMGNRLSLNPFAVFLAIAFCTWLWGPIGAFLGVPLLIVLMVTLENVFGEEERSLPG
jgi:predicted PurR-regulated permease PerM